MKKPEIVFFGSGPVAAKSLALLAEHLNVVAVVSKPKPPHHRGDFPVLSLADKLNLPVFTASNKEQLSELIASKPFDTELAVLIDFGIIVTKDVIDYFPKGIINSHFSLLPEWRGADPITFAILSGQNKTGVSLMLIDEGMDTGKIIRQKSLQIKTEDTASTLTDKLIELSNELLASDIPSYLAGKLKPRNQPHPDRATYSRKLTKEDGILDFTKPAEMLVREVRAFSEWPKSRMNLADLDVIITSASKAEYNYDADENGRVFVAQNNLIGVHTPAGVFLIERLKPSGKPEMTAAAFLAGYGKKLGIL